MSKPLNLDGFTLQDMFDVFHKMGANTMDEAGELVNERFALAARIETLEAALRVFADGDSWNVTAKAVSDGRFGFNAPPESIHVTPWGYARAVLEAGSDD